MKHGYNKEKEELKLTLESNEGFICPHSDIKDILSRPCHNCPWAYMFSGCDDYLTYLDILDEYSAK